MLVMNATNEKVTVKAMGNWFEFKPKQIKNFTHNLGLFLITERSQNGLVHVPDAFEDPEYKATEEGRAQLSDLEKRGIEAFCKGLRQRIYNNQVSLRQDLERSNLKVDPAVLATDGELEAMRLLAKYQDQKDDIEQKKIDEVKDLMKSIKG